MESDVHQAWGYIILGADSVPYRIENERLGIHGGRQSQLWRVCANVGSSRSTLTEPTPSQTPTHTHLTSPHLINQLDLSTTKSLFDLHIT